MPWLVGLLVSVLARLPLAENKIVRTVKAAGQVEVEIGSYRDVLVKSLKRLDANTIQRQRCHINGGNTYANFAQVVHVSFNVASSQECAVLCSVDSITGTDKVCKSFTYNKLTRECNFHDSATPSLHQHSCCDSGAPCTLDGIREDIQEAYQAELVQALQAEKELGVKLATTNKLLLQEEKKEHDVSIELAKASAKPTDLHTTQESAKGTVFLPAHEKGAVPAQTKPVQLKTSQDMQTAQSEIARMKRKLPPSLTRAIELKKVKESISVESKPVDPRKTQGHKALAKTPAAPAVTKQPMHMETKAPAIGLKAQEHPMEMKKVHVERKIGPIEKILAFYKGEAALESRVLPLDKDIETLPVDPVKAEEIREAHWRYATIGFALVGIASAIGMAIAAFNIIYLVAPEQVAKLYCSGKRTTSKIESRLSSKLGTKFSSKGSSYD